LVGLDTASQAWRDATRRDQAEFDRAPQAWYGETGLDKDGRARQHIAGIASRGMAGPRMAGVARRDKDWRRRVGRRRHGPITLGVPRRDQPSLGPPPHRRHGETRQRGT